MHPQILWTHPKLLSLNILTLASVPWLPSQCGVVAMTPRKNPLATTQSLPTLAASKQPTLPPALLSLGNAENANDSAHHSPFQHDATTHNYPPTSNHQGADPCLMHRPQLTVKRTVLPIAVHPSLPSAYLLRKLTFASTPTQASPHSPINHLSTLSGIHSCVAVYLSPPLTR